MSAQLLSEVPALQLTRQQCCKQNVVLNLGKLLLTSSLFWVSLQDTAGTSSLFWDQPRHGRHRRAIDVNCMRLPDSA